MESRQYDRLRPAGTILEPGEETKMANASLDDNMTPLICDSVMTEGFESMLLMAETLAEYAMIGQKMRIIVDYDPQAKKTIITYFGPKEKQTQAGD